MKTPTKIEGLVGESFGRVCLLVSRSVCDALVVDGSFEMQSMWKPERSGIGFGLDARKHVSIIGM